MNHQDFRMMLTLFSYGELSPGDQRKLLEHLENCPECRADQQATVRMLELFGPEFRAVTEPLLEQARRQLSAALPAGAGPAAPRWVRLSEWFGPWLRLPAAAAAAALAGTGFLIGYLAFAPDAGAVQPGSELNGARISALTLEQSTDHPGQVRLSFTVSAPYQVEGSLDDPAILKILAHALVSEANAGVRLQAVGAIAAAERGAADPEVVNALIGALRTDNNPVVRRQALEALRRFPADPEVRRAWVDTLLHDGNTRVRLEAIAALRSLLDSGIPVERELMRRLDEGLAGDRGDFVDRKTREFLQQTGYDRF